MLKQLKRFLLLSMTVFLLSAVSMWAQHTVKGKVLDETKNTMPGVSVKVVGTTIGAITDLNGNYKIVLPKGKNQLQFSFVGYKTLTFNVAKKEVQNVQMQVVAKSLQEVVVVGMGTQKRNTITAAVSTVNQDAIKNRPVTDVTSVLQGNVAGLNLSSSSTESGAGGELGRDIKFNIRGIGSINGGEPYVLVDGVEQSLQSVNPADIASITVLKDASAAAIYGSRAAYGVVLVTTKSGKAGKLHITYNGSIGASSPINLPEMMNSIEYANYKNAYSLASGGGILFSPEFMDKMQKFIQHPYSKEYPGISIGTDNSGNPYFQAGQQYASTDWFAYYFNKFSTRQTHNLSISGGDQKSKFYLGLGFNDDNGLLAEVTDNLKKYTINSKYQFRPNRWFKLDVTNNMAYIDITRPLQNMSILFHEFARQSPNFVTHLPVSPYNLPAWNQRLYMNQAHYTEQRILDALSLGVTITPIEGWNLNAQINGRFNFNANQFRKGQPYTERPDGFVQPVTQPTTGYSPFGVPWRNMLWNSYYRRLDRDIYLSPNLNTSYTHQFGSHYLKVLFGFQSELDNTSGLWGYKTGILSPNTYSFDNASGDPNLYEARDHWSTMGYFTRINYNYQDKYFVELSGRYDGSSRYAPGHRWGLFPSMSLGYDMAREDYFNNWNLPISQMKIRLSYGRLGNQNGVALYQYYNLARLNTSPGPSGWLLPGINATPTSGTLASLGSEASTDLTWEKVDTGDLGLDITAFDDRFTMTVDLYQRTTRDMVGPAEALPAINGIPIDNRPKANNANLRTRGWELSVGWSDKFSNGFSYGISANISDYQSIITKYRNPEGLIYNNHTGLRRNRGYYQGMDIGEIWGYRADDLFKTNQEIDQYLQKVDLSYFKPSDQWQRGDLKYLDTNGDGKVNPGKGTLADHGDLTIIGNTTPRYSFGINMNVGYKGFEVSALWQGVGKRDFPMPGSTYLFNGNTNFFKSQLDYFTPERPNAYLPRLTKAYSTDYNVNAGYNTTRYLLNAAYIRLKNVMVSYTFDHSLVGKWGIQSLKLYISGDNLLTFDKLPQPFDPETLNQVNTWAGGSNASAPGLTSPLSYNGNGKVYPLNRNFVFGINVSF